MATAAEERTANPLTVIRQNLDALAPEFKAALPAHVTVDKFVRVAKTAIQNTPALVNADRRSLFGAFVRLAQDGLLPDGREAAVVMFGNKAQAMPMIAGVLKKIRQSGEVAKVSAQVVYANDKFVVRYGFDEDVEHVPPPLDQPRGDPIGAYATAVLKDGSHLLEVMSLEEIEKVRSVSRAARNGPWVTWFGEMARKTVMRRLSKRLPMSTDLEDEIFSRDQTMQPHPQTIDVEAERRPEPEPEAPPLSRLDAIEHQIVEPEPDPPVETPEIEAQAEEIEAEIVAEAEPANSAAENITENITDAGESDADAGLTEAHPGAAIADAIIAEINDPMCNAVLDVATVLNKHQLDMAAMRDEDAVRVEIAADKKRQAIRAAQAKAKGEADG